MVLYFSGTGNSRYAAERIASALGETLCSLNDRIRSGDFSPVSTGERLILVVPTYAWRIPRLVQSWLMKTDFPDARRIWFVMTCGSEIGNAAQYNRELAQKKRLADMGTAQIVMPENYIAMFDAPQAAQARQIVERAKPALARAIAAIAANQSFVPPRSRTLDRIMSGPVNSLFYTFAVRDRAFTAEGCTGCGQCVRLCPLHNITLENGKPVWGGRCTHCMACICRCPAEAIEYGRKSRGKPRYHFEAL